MIRAEYHDAGVTIITRVYFGETFLFSYRPGTRHKETARQCFETDMGNIVRKLFTEQLDRHSAATVSTTLGGDVYELDDDG